MDLNRWWLKLKWFRWLWRRCGLNKASAWSIALLGITEWVVGVSGWWEAWRLHAWETWSVWCGLRAQLSEVKIRASLVADVHGLAQLALGVVTIKDNSVDGDGDGLDNNLNDAANEGP